MSKFYLILLLWTTTSCYLSEELPEDQQVWLYDQPQSVGLNEGALLSLDADIKDGLFEEIRGMIIIKDGKLVFENYYNTGSRHELRPIGRGTFSIMALATGLLIDDGLIASVDDPIHSYLPEYASIFEEDPEKKEITFRHLLTHTSCLVWDETFGSFHNDVSEMKGNADWVKYILSKELEAPPGSLRIITNSGSGHLLSHIFQNLLDEDLETFLRNRLFARIGIERLEWLRAPDGLPDGTSGLYMSTLDLTRVGYLMLMEGRWLDKKRILSADWIYTLSTEQVPVADYSYGYGWLLFSPSKSQSLSLPESSTFFLAGETGQNLYVIPERNMVICILADNFYGNLFNHSYRLFVRVLGASEPGTMN